MLPISTTRSKERRRPQTRGEEAELLEDRSNNTATRKLPLHLLDLSKILALKDQNPNQPFHDLHLLQMQLKIGLSATNERAEQINGTGEIIEAAARLILKMTEELKILVTQISSISNQLLSTSLNFVSGEALIRRARGKVIAALFYLHVNSREAFQEKNTLLLFEMTGMKATRIKLLRLVEAPELAKGIVAFRKEMKEIADKSGEGKDQIQFEIYDPNIPPAPINVERRCLCCPDQVLDSTAEHAPYVCETRRLAQDASSCLGRLSKEKPIDMIGEIDTASFVFHQLKAMRLGRH